MTSGTGDGDSDRRQITARRLADLAELGGVACPPEGSAGAEFLRRVAAQVVAYHAGEPHRVPGAMTTIDIADLAVPRDDGHVAVTWVDLGLGNVDQVSECSQRRPARADVAGPADPTTRARTDLHLVALQLAAALVPQLWPLPPPDASDALRAVLHPQPITASATDCAPLLTPEQYVELGRLTFLRQVTTLSPTQHALWHVYRYRDRQSRVRGQGQAGIPAADPADHRG